MEGEPDSRWGGRTDPALQHNYFTLGLVAFCFGFGLLGAGAWVWLTCGGATSHRNVTGSPPIGKPSPRYEQFVDESAGVVECHLALGRVGFCFL
jgi:hypothetical protein